MIRLKLFDQYFEQKRLQSNEFLVALFLFQRPTDDDSSCLRFIGSCLEIIPCEDGFSAKCRKMRSNENSAVFTVCSPRCRICVGPGRRIWIRTYDLKSNRPGEFTYFPYLNNVPHVTELSKLIFALVFGQSKIVHGNEPHLNEQYLVAGTRIDGSQALNITEWLLLRGRPVLLPVHRSRQSHSHAAWIRVDLAKRPSTFRDYSKSFANRWSYDRSVVRRRRARFSLCPQLVRSTRKKSNLMKSRSLLWNTMPARSIVHRSIFRMCMCAAVAPNANENK